MPQLSGVGAAAFRVYICAQCRPDTLHSALCNLDVQAIAWQTVAGRKIQPAMATQGVLWCPMHISVNHRLTKLGSSGWQHQPLASCTALGHKLPTKTCSSPRPPCLPPHASLLGSPYLRESPQVTKVVACTAALIPRITAIVAAMNHGDAAYALRLFKNLVGMQILQWILSWLDWLFAADQPAQVVFGKLAACVTWKPVRIV